MNNNQHAPLYAHFEAPPIIPVQPRLGERFDTKTEKIIQRRWAQIEELTFLSIAAADERLAKVYSRPCPGRGSSSLSGLRKRLTRVDLPPRTAPTK